MSGNAKGFVWFNNTPLGRFWNIGPQYALWTPGSWMHAGANDVILFDLMSKSKPHLATSADWVAAPTIAATQ